MINEASGGDDVCDDSKSSPADPEGRESLEQLVQKANQGDSEAIQALRRYLDERVDLAKKLGDLAWHVETSLIAKIANGNALGIEAIRRQVAQLREELAGDTPSPIERLLADQVVAVYLEGQYLQLKQTEASGTTQGRTTLHMKRLESSQKRLTKALKTLAIVRKMGTAVWGTRLRVFSGKTG
jgi:uncharacterized protein YbcI